MAREVGTERAKPAAVDCDLCHERKGRNATAVHILKFADPDALAGHLKTVFPDTPYCVEYFLNLWGMAHRIYGNEARNKYAPLWLVYMEAHGVRVNNRADAIMKFRGHAEYSPG